MGLPAASEAKQVFEHWHLDAISLLSFRRKFLSVRDDFSSRRSKMFSLRRAADSTPKDRCQQVSREKAPHFWPVFSKTNTGSVIRKGSWPAVELSREQHPIFRWIKQTVFGAVRLGRRTGRLFSGWSIRRLTCAYVNRLNHPSFIISRVDGHYALRVRAACAYGNFGRAVARLFGLLTQNRRPSVLSPIASAYSAHAAHRLPHSRKTSQDGELVG